MAFGDVMNKLFGSGTPTPAQVMQVQMVPAPNNPTGVAQPGMPLPSSDPNNPTVPVGTADPATVPLDAFADLWKTAPIDPNAPPADNGNYFQNFDPKNVMESARKVNFSNQEVTPEQAAAIAAGGPEAIKAVRSLINASSQQVYGQSAIATASIVQKALEAQAERFKAQLPGLMKNQAVTDSLATENPIFKNPALQPMVDMARTQILQKFPNATQAEVKEQVVNFFNAMQGALAPKPKVSAADKANETNWDDWISQ